MANNQYGTLEERKKAAEDLLSEAFARDLLTIDQLETRLIAVNSASNDDHISVQIQDLPKYVSAAAPRAELSDEPIKANSILSSRTLHGNKLRQQRIQSKIIMGEQKFDYSKTLLEPGKYYIDAKVYLGSLTIIVPENYAVSVDMDAIMSEIKERDICDPGPGIPEIVLRGKAVMGEVIVKVKKDGIISRIKNLLEDL
jgi:hypothetical protein